MSGRGFRFLLHRSLAASQLPGRAPEQEGSGAPVPPQGAQGLLCPPVCGELPRAVPCRVPVTSLPTWGRRSVLAEAALGFHLLLLTLCYAKPQASPALPKLPCSAETEFFSFSFNELRRGSSSVNCFKHCIYIRIGAD